MSNAIIAGVARVGTLPARHARHARRAGVSRRLAAHATRFALGFVGFFPTGFVLCATAGPQLLLVAAQACAGNPVARAQMVIHGCAFLLGGLAGAAAIRAALTVGARRRAPILQAAPRLAVRAGMRAARA